VPTAQTDVARESTDGILGIARGVVSGASGLLSGIGGKLVGIAGKLCKLGGELPTLAGRVCDAVNGGGSLLSTGKTLLGGSASGLAKTALTAAALVGLAVAAAHAAKAALHELAHVIGATTDPQVRADWFSGPYWRVAGLSFLLTLPFLFAAVIQALVRSDLALLARAAFGYLPLSILAICIAQPVTALLLSASDAMSSTVNAAGSGGDTQFLTVLATSVGGLSGVAGSAFLGLMLAIVIVSAAIALTLEMLAREAAVYVVLLMLPLTFAAMVWPARRVWAVKTVEVLVALILSKFVIVAILTLSESAFGHLSENGIGTLMAGITLLMLAAFSPWVLIKLIPFSEVAAGIGGALAPERSRLARYAEIANGGDSMIAEARSANTEPFAEETPARPEQQPLLGAGDDGPDRLGPPGDGPGGGPQGGGRPPGGGPPGGIGPAGAADLPSGDGIPDGGGGPPPGEPGVRTDPRPGSGPAVLSSRSRTQAAIAELVGALRQATGGPDEPLTLGPSTRAPLEAGARPTVSPEPSGEPPQSASVEPSAEPPPRVESTRVDDPEPLPEAQSTGDGAL
jgi:hypothetical protein